MLQPAGTQDERENGVTRERAVRHFRSGLYWIGTASALELVLNLLKLVVVARLLSKADLGVFAMALVFIGFIENISRTGFGQALIQTRSDPEPYVDAVWSYVILKNAVIGLLGILAAPAIAVFFHEPRVAPLVRILGASYMISGLRSQRLPLLRRDLRFKRVALIRYCTVALQVSVAVTLALLTRNVYALVGGFAVGQIGEVVFSHAFNWKKPRFRLDLRKTRELFGYGGWITLESGIQYFGQTLDRAMLGKLLNSASLGLYSVAGNMVQTMMSLSGTIISDTMFPLFSRIQEEKVRITSWITRLSAASIVLGGFFASFLAGTARFFVPLLFGDKWTSSIPIVEILAVSPIFYLPVFMSGQPFFKGIGRPDIMTKIQIVRIAILFPASWAAIRSHGVRGLAWAVVGTLAGVTLYWLSRMARAGVRVGGLFLALGLSGGMAALSWGLSRIILAGRPVGFASLALSGILVGAILGLALGAAFLFLRPTRAMFRSLKELLRSGPA